LERAVLKTALFSFG